MPAVRRVAVALPTEWDLRHLALGLAGPAPPWRAEYAVTFLPPLDADVRADLDPVAWVAEAAAAHRGALDGVCSSSDYPGATLAAALAQALGLPGPGPRAVLHASHKWYSRRRQQAAVPEAVPGFDLVPIGRPRAGPPATGFPCFVKPVKGAFSQFARRVDDAAALDALLASPSLHEFATGFLRIFDRCLAAWGDPSVGAGHLIAEGLLAGQLVTVDGFVQRGHVHVQGVVDATCHPRTGSFVRFDYPSALPPDAQAALANVAARAVAAVGLDDACWNVEAFWDRAARRPWIVELNPRLAGQFADLHGWVDGVHGYAVALAVATGTSPPARPARGPHAFAASVPLRVWEPARVVAAPTAAAVAALEADVPATAVTVDCAPGQVLADFDTEDGGSARYAVINLAAESREALDRKLAVVTERLGFPFKRP